VDTHTVTGFLLGAIVSCHVRVDTVTENSKLSFADFKVKQRWDWKSIFSTVVVAVPAIPHLASTAPMITANRSKAIWGLRPREWVKTA
jgi:hypothetical protein